MLTTTLLTAVAFVTAVISGMAGLGGGTILVAVMFIVGLPPAVAVPVHAAVQAVSNLSRTGVFARHVSVHALSIYAIAAVPTPFLVAPWVARVPSDWAKLTLGLFILVITWAPKLRATGQSTVVAMLAAGALAGGAGMVVGATGTLVGPFFLRDGWSKERIIGTSTACQGAAHIVKLAAFGRLGFALNSHARLVAPMCVAVVGGTLLGKRFVGRIEAQTFRRIFRVLLTIGGLKLAVLAAYALAT